MMLCDYMTRMNMDLCTVMWSQPDHVWLKLYFIWNSTFVWKTELTSVVGLSTIARLTGVSWIYRWEGRGWLEPGGAEGTLTSSETESILRPRRVSIRFFLFFFLLLISCWDTGALLKVAPKEINGSVGGAVRAARHKVTTAVNFDCTLKPSMQRRCYRIAAFCIFLAENNLIVWVKADKHY